MDCHSDKGQIIENEEKALRFLLMGNPNVGKSVIFSKLTGIEVMASNYTGTTVSFTKGLIPKLKEPAVLVDVPGTYSMKATSEAEQVAVNFVDDEIMPPDAIICVLDATNLERNINFALQLKRYNIPTIYLLNLSDVAKEQGINIDLELLEEELGSKVIPTVAVRNIGLNEALDEMKKVKKIDNRSREKIDKYEDEELRWQEVGRIIEKVQTLEEKEPSFLEKLGQKTMEPFPGIPIAIFVLILSLGLVVGLGKAVRGGLLLPLLNNYYVPNITALVDYFIGIGGVETFLDTYLNAEIFRNVLVGEYGVLIKAIEWPFALVLPYVAIFYIVLSVLEDSGYLPRIGVLLDGLLRKIGIQGGSIIPFIMGYGCAIPAILGTKAATTHKERVIIATLVSLAVPCTAQTAVFFVLLGDISILLVIAMFMLSFLAIILGGIVLNRAIPGKVDPMLLEIPNLLRPDAKTVLKKIRIRLKMFIKEAEVPMIIGILIAAIVAETGILNLVTDFLEPLITGWLGLPKEAGLGLMLGIIRRELTVLPFMELDMTTLQLFVGSTVALFYLPCLSVLAILIKEFKLKTGLLIAGSTLVFAFLLGGIINHTVLFFSGLF